MTDTNDQISNKIKKAKTDSMNMPATIDDATNRPEINNLLDIYSACSNKKKEDSISDFSGKEISFFKSSLTEAVISIIEPISIKAKDLMNDQSHLDKILEKGADNASKIATTKIKAIHKLIGMA